MAGTLGEANPFRYRSYYYDIETGLYYRQSRYYNPEWGRWINADDPALLELNSGELIGANLFAYCHNNPVNFIDRTGMWAEDIHFGKQSGSTWIYGTRKWAVDCGMSAAHAVIIADANKAQDNVNNHAALIWNLNKHFRAHGAYDYANARYWSAVNIWKNAVAMVKMGWWGPAAGEARKKEALQELGRALHAMQDYYAHLDWKVDASYNKRYWGIHTSWEWVYKNKKWQWETSTKYFDNVDYNVWRGTGVNANFYFHKWVGRTNNPRYKLTEEVTKLWINCFKKETGYKP